MGLGDLIDDASFTFIFSTSNNSGSLVGFMGGTIYGGGVNGAPAPYGYYFINTGGSITPVVTPEPSSLLLTLVGLGTLALLGLNRAAPRGQIHGLWSPGYAGRTT